MRNFYYWIKFSISSALLRPNTRILRYGVPHADGYVNMFPLTNRERQKRKHDNSIGQRDSNFMYNATPRHATAAPLSRVLGAYINSRSLIKSYTFTRPCLPCATHAMTTCHILISPRFFPATDQTTIHKRWANYKSTTHIPTGF